MTVKQAGRNIIMAIVENGAQIIQLTLATNALGVGIILLEPAGTSFNASPTWRWMSQHGTEQQWAALCLFIALIGFYGMVAPQRWSRVGSSFGMSIFTGVLSISFFISAPNLTGWFTYGLFTLLSYWLCWYRIFRE